MCHDTVHAKLSKLIAAGIATKARLVDGMIDAVRIVLSQMLKERFGTCKGGKTKCDERKDDGNVGKELMERELGEIEGAEGCHNQM